LPRSFAVYLRNRTSSIETRSAPAFAHCYPRSLPSISGIPFPRFLGSLDIFMNPMRVEVNDEMQKGYVYFRTKPMGRAFRPGFTPQLTPKQMLELGVFGGKYLTDCRKEFPASWFKRAKLSPHRPQASVNYFGVNASQPLAEWRRKGWIHPDDPRGWFQWYCRYYCGRRSQDDLRQIARWRAVRRHLAQLKKHCKPRDLNCRRRQRQALLHWAYDSRKI
jgi:hypothetical protein